MNYYRKFDYYCYFKNEFIKYYLPEMKETIGVIDFEILESRDIMCLYYLFPLIERLVVEILKYKTDADIEFFKQGTYRTLNSIVFKEENSKYFDSNIINYITRYYADNGLRNKLLHFRGETYIDVSIVDLLEIKVIVLKLIKLYNLALKEFDYIEKINIELL